MGLRRSRVTDIIIIISSSSSSRRCSCSSTIASSQRSLLFAADVYNSGQLLHRFFGALSSQDWSFWRRSCCAVAAAATALLPLPRAKSRRRHDPRGTALINTVTTNLFRRGRGVFFRPFPSFPFPLSFRRTEVAPQIQLRDVAERC